MRMAAVRDTWGPGVCVFVRARPPALKKLPLVVM